METTVENKSLDRIRIMQDVVFPSHYDQSIENGLRALQRVMESSFYSVSSEQVALYLSPLKDQSPTFFRSYEEVSVALINVFLADVFQVGVPDEDGKDLRDLESKEIATHCQPLLDHFLVNLYKVAHDFPGVEEAWDALQEQVKGSETLRYRHMTEEGHFRRMEEILKTSEEATFRLLDIVFQEAFKAHTELRWPDFSQLIKQAEHLVELLGDTSVDEPDLQRQEDLLRVGNRLFQQIIEKAGWALRQNNWHLMDLHMHHTSDLAKLLSRLACYHEG